MAAFLSRNVCRNTRSSLHFRSINRKSNTYILNQPLRFNSTAASSIEQIAEHASEPSRSLLSNITSKLSLEIRQEDTNLEAMSSQFTGEYKPWFIEKWFETPIGVIQDGLEIIHFGLGLPWWSTIAVTAIAVRLACFPLLVINAKQVYGLMDAQPVLKLIQDEYKRKKKDDEFEGRMDEKAWFQDLYKKTTDITGYRLYKMFLYPLGLVCSLPPFIFAARAIARRTNHDLDEGGLLWFVNLAKPDMHTVLPFVAVGFTWCVFAFKAGRWLDGRYSGMYHKYVSFVYFFISMWPIVMLALMVDAPAGIYCYWLPFSLFGLFSKVFMHSPAMRKRLNIPPPRARPSEPVNNELNKYYHSLLRKYKRIHAKPLIAPSKQTRHIKPIKEIPSMTVKQLTNPQNAMVSLLKKVKGKMKDNNKQEESPIKFERVRLKKK